MISTKLLNVALDAIKNSNPVAELAESLRSQGVTEEQLIAALTGRSDSDFRRVAQTVSATTCSASPSTNKYGVAKNIKKAP